MGRSLRRAKKTRPKISIKKKRQPLTRAKVPVEITSQRPDVEAKLGSPAEWNREKALHSNYASNLFQSDPNEGFGRNAAPPKPVEEIIVETAADVESDDDLRTLENRPRRDGKRSQPSRLTGNQQQVIQRLIEAHGQDVEAMVKDNKLNPMLLPASKLKKLLAAHDLHGSSGRCGFRVPNKRLW
ncbi:g13181 [Coccomyxa viridis]|uniref:Nucleolar protein 16 n=1 Tax=Coccomyxa viridis TaxID=1274662 RepID=A0ABP1GC54_9CHLO